MPKTIAQERQLFQASIEDLIAKGMEGKYVLFKEGKVQGFFGSEREAREAGLDRYGLDVFIVDLVVKQRSSWIPPEMHFWRE